MIPNAEAASFLRTMSVLFREPMAALFSRDNGNGPIASVLDPFWSLHLYLSSELVII